MINGQSVLAVIPARGGSKRAPGKNIRFFRGKALIAWSIQAALESMYIDHFVVSTEDPAIKWVAESYGAYVLDRPPALAADDATNEDVLRHAAVTVPGRHDWIVLLQPTSPLRVASDIDACIAIATRNGLGCISYRQRNCTKNGAVYVASREWLSVNDFTTPLPGVYLMTDEQSADLDYPEEFELYE